MGLALESTPAELSQATPLIHAEFLHIKWVEGDAYIILDMLICLHFKMTYLNLISKEAVKNIRYSIKTLGYELDFILALHHCPPLPCFLSMFLQCCFNCFTSGGKENDKPIGKSIPSGPNPGQSHWIDRFREETAIGSLNKSPHCVCTRVPQGVA